MLTWSLLLSPNDHLNLELPAGSVATAAFDCMIKCTAVLGAATCIYALNWRLNTMPWVLMVEAKAWTILCRCNAHSWGNNNTTGKFVKARRH